MFSIFLFFYTHLGEGALDIPDHDDTQCVYNISRHDALCTIGVLGDDVDKEEVDKGNHDPPQQHAHH